MKSKQIQQHHHPHQQNHDDELEKWPRIASNLEKRLKVAETQNVKLKQSLKRTRVELEDTRTEHEFQSERVNDLEFQCLEKSAKLSELSDILEARGNTSDVQEMLLRKSMEHAEATLSVDRLRLELRKSDSTRRTVHHENVTLKEVNEDLSRKLERTTVAWDKTSREKDRNGKLLLELGDIVRTLNCVTVSFDQDCSSPHKDGSSPQDSPIKNIKRKIEALESDRQRLQDECKSLRQVNGTQQKWLKALEYGSDRSNCHSYSSDGKKHVGRHPLDDPIATQTSPLSINTEILEQDDKYDDYSHSHDRSNDSDDVSSFSSLDPPDVPLETFEALKHDYEEAVEKIVSMSAELGKAKAIEQEYNEGQEDITQLNHQCESLKKERDGASQDISVLERELEDALNVAEEAASQNVQLKEALEKKLANQLREYETLQTQYDEFQKDYTVKLEELEGQVTKSEEFFHIKCEGLKKQHKNKMEAISKEDHQLNLDHETKLETQQERYKELNYEFDTFVEMHTELEDELAEVQNKYDEALTQIVTLEDQVQEVTELLELKRSEHLNDISQKDKLATELQGALEKSRSAMQEVIMKHQKLRREHDAALAKLGGILVQVKAAEEKTSRDTETMRDLNENCCDMEERLKMVEQDTAARLNNLEASYKQALGKLHELVVHLQASGLSIELLESISKQSSPDPVFERILKLERELVGDRTIGPMQLGNVYGNTSPGHGRFEDDYREIIKHIPNDRFYSESQSEKESNMTPFHQLFHQSKLLRVLRELVSLSSIAHSPGTSSFDSNSLYDRLKHQKRLTKVHEAISGILAVSSSMAVSIPQTLDDFLKHARRLERVRAELGEPMNIVSPSRKEIQQDEPSMLINGSFLQHQRRLTAVHFDVIARARTFRSCTSVPRRESLSLPDTCDSETWHSKSSENPNEAKTAIRKLQGEARKIKIAANTARIRFEAREKEHRVVRFQYKKLLEELNEAEAQHVRAEEIKETPVVQGQDSKISSDKSIDTGDKTNPIEFKRLRKDLRAAELKVEMMSIELRFTKANADIAQKKQKEGEKHLHIAIGEYNSYEGERSATSKTAFASDRTSKGKNDGEIGGIFRQPFKKSVLQCAIGKPRALGHESRTLDLIASFDCSHLSSFGCSISAEARDEKGDHEKMQYLGETTAEIFAIPIEEHQAALKTISCLSRELSDAEKDAKDAKSRLEEREDDLRSIIQKYKELKMESGKVGWKKDEFPNERAAQSLGDITRQRDVALARISLLEVEVEDAKNSALKARKKQSVMIEHLRQVIDQYKELDSSYQEAKKKIEKLQKFNRSRKSDLTIQDKDQTGRESPESIGETKAIWSQQRTNGKRPQKVKLSEPSKVGLQSRCGGSDEQRQNDKMARTGKASRKPWFKPLRHRTES